MILQKTTIIQEVSCYLVNLIAFKDAPKLEFKQYISEELSKFTA